MTISEMDKLINCCNILGIKTVAELKQFKDNYKAKSNFDLLCKLEKVIQEQNNDN